jgi:hypothetical protein
MFNTCKKLHSIFGAPRAAKIRNKSGPFVSKKVWNEALGGQTAEPETDASEEHLT